MQSDSVSLSWSPPEGTPGPHRFRVTWRGGQKHHSMTVGRLGLTATELIPGERYHFAVATLSEDDHQSSCVEGYVHTEVPPPENLIVNLSSLTASLKWTKPASVDQVSYQVELFRDQKSIDAVHRYSPNHTITGLQPGGNYTVSVYTILSNGLQSKPSSQYFRTDSMRELTASVCIHKHPDDYIWDRNEHNKDIYRQKMTTEKEGFCSKRSFGPPALNAQNKTTLLVGATGAGKHTLINAMINYILGVEWEDSSRIEMIPKDTGATEAHSQTSKVTAYQINHREGYRVPYSLTIIDTPGFGDTRGVKQDQEITKRIKEFFSDPTGVTSIDAVCFVVQSALPRLTHTQKYIFDSILSIFGKDIKDNIVMLFTFSDGKAPAALAAINAADVPCARKEDGSCVYFKFNNSVLYSGDDDPFDEMFWKMGLISMKTFFDQLSKMKCKSLQLTREVLEERLILEIIVEGLLPKIKVGLAKSEEVTKTLAAMEHHRQLAEANKNFEFEVETVEIIKEDISGQGIHVTNCRTCSFTCHDDCAYADDWEKQKCPAMKNGSCTVCPGKCHWTAHSNMPYRFIIKTKKEKRTYENLKKNYEQAVGKCLSIDEAMQGLYNDYTAIQKEVLDFTEQLSKSQKRLGEIALRPNPMTATDYIDLMIKGEKQAGQPGWDARINELIEVRKGAEVLQKVAKKEKLLPAETQILSKWGNIKKNIKSVFRGLGNWF